MAEQATQPRGWTGIRVSLVIKERLRHDAARLTEDLGRPISYSEVIERLYINQIGLYANQEDDQ